MEHVSVAQLCGATSLFTDLGTGQPSGHGLRTCLIAMRLADALALDPVARSEVYYVSLLRFLGCTADSHILAGVAGGDEIRFLAGMAPVTMGPARESVGRLLGLVAVGQPLPQRISALARALADSDGGARLLAAHCEVAARLATAMGLPAAVAEALEVGYARWDGHGVPAGLGGSDIPIAIRISIVARDLELWARETGDDTAREVLARRRGRAYDPETVTAALEIGPARLRDYGVDPWTKVLGQEPPPRVRLSGAALDRALTALGDYADLKVPERTGYSRRVARVVSRAAGIAGLVTTDAQTLVRAALVHDLGVVAVPVDAWRAGRTSEGGVANELVRLHPHWSSRILGRCPALAEVAAAARNHHERRDGSGYPSGVTGDLGRVSGLLACAVRHDELASDHAAGPPSDGLAELARRGALDTRDVDAVLGAAGASRPPAPSGTWPAGLTDREVDVLRRLARGATNRQVAQELGISIKTVSAHVEHIYAKAQVRSRAAAALFAMQHDLLR